MPETPATFQSHARSPSLRLLARISQYELLSRMWSEKSAADPFHQPQLPLVLSRDFAYEDSTPMILDDLSENVGEISFKDYSEYVHPIPILSCVRFAHLNHGSVSSRLTRARPIISFMVRVTKSLY